MAGMLNALELNEETGAIVIGRGATGCFQVDIEADEILHPDVDVAVFAIGRQRSQNYRSIFRKTCAILQRAGGGYSVVVELANEDTRDLTPASYVWTLILVTDPEYENDGTVIVEDRTDGVYPLWVGENQPAFEVRGGASVI